MLTPSLEDYLEESYRLFQEHGRVRPKDLALSMNVSMPSVTRALQRLDRAGYIKYQVYGEIVLREEGKRIGHYLVHRNRIIRDFLVVLDTPCDVREEAEAMEHYFTPETIERLGYLTAFLNRPGYRDAFAASVRETQQTDGLGHENAH